ncbi:hypothetical protein WISP_131561 [Willisornis vidua]|uniref:Uncharacterized protein n=1 Tax=Willisornis vidua TaxID=1566151 RepID=A0ABQ9CUI5_9PASS|nr:hypothetical protein WISP_131561 [Willisornis vidua]
MAARSQKTDITGNKRALLEKKPKSLSVYVKYQAVNLKNGFICDLDYAVVLFDIPVTRAVLKMLPSVLESRPTCQIDLSSPSKPKVFLIIEDDHDKTKTTRIKFLHENRINHETE